MPLKHPLLQYPPYLYQVIFKLHHLRKRDSWGKIDFTVTADDESGGSLTYTWDFGDGNTGSGTSVSHTYAVLAPMM